MRKQVTGLREGIDEISVILKEALNMLKKHTGEVEIQTINTPGMEED